MLTVGNGYRKVHAGKIIEVEIFVFLTPGPVTLGNRLLKHKGWLRGLSGVVGLGGGWNG